MKKWPAKEEEMEEFLQRLTPAQVAEMFALAVPALGIPEKTAKGRVRRVSHLAWNTIAALKRPKLAPEDADAAHHLVAMQDS